MARLGRRIIVFDVFDDVGEMHPVDSGAARHQRSAVRTGV